MNTTHLIQLPLPHPSLPSPELKDTEGMIDF